LAHREDKREHKEEGERRVILGKRVLIVGDEQAICLIIAHALRKNGYRCVIVNSWEEALHHFYGDDISLILCDINIPNMNGVVLLKQIKYLNPKTVMIFLIPYPKSEVAIEAIRLGADDFITKPINLDRLVFRVERAFENNKYDKVIGGYNGYLGNFEGARIPELQTVSSGWKKPHLDSIGVLTGAIKSKDPYTRGHSDRVRSLAIRIGTRLGFSSKKLEALVFGALLHDIGKIAIKDEVLRKPGLLSSEEYRQVQQHPLIGVEILETFDIFPNMNFMIRYHHERFDGAGYPDGLAGEEIPIEARIIGISDAFDAMTSLRPHRARMTFEMALKEMKDGAGKQFDPAILETFLEEMLCDSPPDYSPESRASNLLHYRHILSQSNHYGRLNFVSW
jgi:putative two-component system response regulator